MGTYWYIRKNIGGYTLMIGIMVLILLFCIVSVTQALQRREKGEGGVKRQSDFGTAAKSKDAWFSWTKRILGQKVCLTGICKAKKLLPKPTSPVMVVACWGIPSSKAMTSSPAKSRHEAVSIWCPETD